MLTVKEVAKQLNISEGTIRNLIKSGILKSLKIGKQYRIKLEDLHSYIGVSSTHINKDLADETGIDTKGEE